MFVKRENNKAFTILELTIAVLISSIVLIFLMSFLADTFNEIAYSNKKTKILIDLYEIEDKLKNIKNQYLSGSLLKDNDTGIGSDIILLSTIPGEPKQGGYIIAQVDKSKLKIDPNYNVDNIGEKVFGYRKISGNELNEILIDEDKIYEYKFNLDEIYPNLILKDLQASMYNSGSIFNLEMYINLDYKIEMNDIKYSEIRRNRIEKIIFNF